MEIVYPRRPLRHRCGSEKRSADGWHTVPYAAPALNKFTPPALPTPIDEVKQLHRLRRRSAGTPSASSASVDGSGVTTKSSV